MSDRVSRYLGILVILSHVLMVTPDISAVPPAAGPSSVDASAFVSLNEAVKSASGSAIVIRGPVALADDLVVPAGTGISIVPGGRVENKGKYSLTVNGPFSADLSQVFYGFSDGQVTFGNSSVASVWPQWWGAKGDGTTDDTAALRLVLSSIARGVRMTSPKGHYRISDTIDLTALGPGYALKEIDWGNSVISWVGPANRPMFKLYQNKNLIFRNFELDCRDTAGVDGIWIDSTQPEFMFNYTITSFGISHCNVGMLFGVNAAKAPNVSNAEISHFAVNYNGTGIKINTSNANLINFRIGVLSGNEIDLHINAGGAIEFQQVNGFGARSDGGINAFIYVTGYVHNLRLVNCQKEAGSNKGHPFTPNYFLRVNAYGWYSQNALSVIDCAADSDILFEPRDPHDAVIVNFIGGYTRNVTVNSADVRLNYIGTYGQKYAVSPAPATITLATSGARLTNLGGKIDSVVSLTHRDAEYINYDKLSRYEGSRSNPGWKSLPDGTLFQWGTTPPRRLLPGEAFEFTVTFPKPFPGAVQTALGSLADRSAEKGVSVWVRQSDTKSMTVRAVNGDTATHDVGVSWFAIGY